MTKPADFQPDLSDLEAIDDPETTPARVPPYESVAKATLRGAIEDDLLNMIRGPRPIALIVSVPSEDWVTPLMYALDDLRRWDDTILAPTKASRRPCGSDCARRLAKGQSVVGIAVSPERQLPTALLTAADARIAIRSPGNPAIAEAIALATGEEPSSMPDRVATGLNYHDIVAAIRLGSTADECVRRLAKAAATTSTTDPLLADVPPLEEMHGYGAAGEWGFRLVRDLRSWRKGELPFEDIDRHAVLASEPGLGKTTFVRALAKSAGIPLFVTSVASWFTAGDGHLGSVMTEVDRVFGTASACSPAIVFLDEIDALPNRQTVGSRNRDFWVPVVSGILTTLDGAASGETSRLIVIGATNHADRIDPALVRPGRLNRVLYIHPPKPGDLAAILRQHLGADLPDADLLPVAHLSAGATGAQCMGWVKEARAMARTEGRAVQLDDLVAAIAPPSHSPPEERRRIAVHEAGHAVLSHRLRPGCVRSVSTVVRGGSAGHTLTTAMLGLSPTLAEIELDVICTLAGRAAEEVITGEPSVGCGGSADSDLGMATIQVASALYAYGLGDSLAFVASPADSLELLRRDTQLRAAVSHRLAELHRRAVTAVRENRPAIDAVVAALLARRHLAGEEFLSVIDDADSGSDRTKDDVAALQDHGGLPVTA